MTHQMISNSHPDIEQILHCQLPYQGGFSPAQETHFSPLPRLIPLTRQNKPNRPKTTKERKKFVHIIPRRCAQLWSIPEPQASPNNLIAFPLPPVSLSFSRRRRAIYMGISRRSSTSS